MAGDRDAWRQCEFLQPENRLYNAAWDAPALAEDAFKSSVPFTKWSFGSLGSNAPRLCSPVRRMFTPGLTQYTHRDTDTNAGRHLDTNTHRGWKTTSRTHTCGSRGTIVLSLHRQTKNKDLELYCLSTHTHALPWLVTFEHLWHQKWTQVCPQTSLCACCSGPLTKICSESFYIINSSLCFYSCLSSILSATYVSAPKSPRDAWGAHYMLPAFFSSHLFLISTKMHICLCMLIKRRPDPFFVPSSTSQRNGMFISSWGRGCGEEFFTWPSCSCKWWKLEGLQLLCCVRAWRAEMQSNNNVSQYSFISCVCVFCSMCFIAAGVLGSGTQKSCCSEINR